MSEVAHHHALVQYMGAEAAKLSSSPAVRKRQDAQLNKAAIAADAAAKALKALVENWSPHLEARGQAALSSWADAVTCAC